MVFVRGNGGLILAYFSSAFSLQGLYNSCSTGSTVKCLVSNSAAITSWLYDYGQATFLSCGFHCILQIIISEDFIDN